MPDCLPAQPLPRFSLTQGDTVPFTLSITRDGRGTTITSLSGWTITFAVIDDEAGDDAIPGILYSNVGDSPKIAIASTVASWAITGADALKLSPGRSYTWAVKVLTPAGDTTTLRRGRFAIAPDITS